MKFRLKGFKSLIKAVQNRAHLFPVKVLVNGKTKTYYSIRYKTGNKAMEIAKKQMKIPDNVEALFDTKDGEKKNLTEKDVLKIYDKAGKPGSLQDFIQANFKKPKQKNQKLRTVTSKDQQMSFDDLAQGDKKKNNKEVSGKEKTEKLWQEFEKWREKADNDLFGIVNSYHKKVEDMTPSEYRKIMEHFFKEEIARGYTQSGETLDECLENYIQMFKDQIKREEDEKNAWNEEYYKEIYNHLEQIYKKGDWLFELDAKKYIRQFIWDKVGLDRSAAENAGKAALKDILVKNGEYKEKEEKKDPESGITITGPIYDDDERPIYYINDNGNVIETQDTKIVDQYRAKQKQQEENQGQEPQKSNTNESQDTKLTTDELEAVEYYISGDGMYINDYLRNRDNPVDRMGPMSRKDRELVSKLESITNREHSNKTLYRSVDASAVFGNISESDWDNLREQLLYNRDNKAESTINNLKGKVVTDEGFMSTTKDYNKALDFDDFTAAEHPIILKLTNANEVKGFDVGKYMPELNKKMDQEEVILHNNSRYVIKDIIGKDGKIQVIGEFVQETQGNEPDLNALAEQNQALEGKRAKQRLREYSKEYVEEYKERNTLDDLNARDRFGTKKIESKGEYKQVSNINELIDKARAIKDYHVDIKGRAILDMLGVNIPMYAKRNGKLFAGKNLGYCRAIVNEETGQVMPYEIGIVAETSNKTRETGTVIHEAMHAKIKGISDNMLNKCAIKGGLSEAEVQHNVEESLVEMAGFSLAKTIHAGDSYRGYMTYPAEISLTLPRIWDIEEFKEARKKGIDGIGKEIYNQIMAGNREFIDKIVNTYVSDEAKEKASKRTAAIEKTMLDRTDKLETITGGNEKSPIGNLVEELKRGTISLEVALNSSKYGTIAAVLITKFLEDEDLDGIDALIGSL